MIRVIINGVMGKMGRAVAEAVSADAGAGEQVLVVAAGVDLFAAGATASYPIFETLSQCDVPADVVVDFTRADALPGVLDFCLKRKLPCVIATTGMDAEQQRMMDEAAKRIPVFQCANMSLGVNLMVDLIRTAALALSNRFDIEIIEAHHNTKLDSPSGTAYMLLRALQGVVGEGSDAVFDRSGRHERRRPKEIGVSAIRGGTVTGMHEVMFLGPDEVLTIKHEAQSRRIFALGAVAAVRYIYQQRLRPGRYAMEDLITEQTAVERLYTERDQAMMAVRDVSQREAAVLFSALAEAGVNLDMISQAAPADGKVQVSFTLPADALPAAENALTGTSYEVSKGLVKLAVEGTGMARKPGVAARVFGLLADQGTPPLLITTSETKIAVCIAQGDETGAETALREAFDL